MEEGTGIATYILVAVIIFGLFIGISVLFGEGVLAKSNDIIACVESYMSDEPTDCGGSGEDDEIPNYVLATDKDFVGTANGEFIYTGDAEYVKLPHSIKGVELTSYRNMFNGSSVKKVVSDNPNVTDMAWMFRDSKATELDVSGIDTSNVRDMGAMFEGSKATDLDLSNFNTSKVTNMGWMFNNSKATGIDVSNFDTSNVKSMYRMFSDSKATELDVSRFDTSKVKNMHRMFYGSHATELDLSNFDTSNVTDTTDMFYRSQANKVYVRTQADADKYNASSNKPGGLQVIVKQ